MTLEKKEGRHGTREPEQISKSSSASTEAPPPTLGKKGKKAWGRWQRAPQHWYSWLERGRISGKINQSRESQGGKQTGEKGEEEQSGRTLRHRKEEIRRGHIP